MTFSYSYTYIYIHIYIYIHMPVMFVNGLGLQPFEGLECVPSPPVLRPISALNWIDRPDPYTLCQALQPNSSFSWFSFALELFCGALLCAVIEFLLTLRWALQTWIATTASTTAGSESRRVAKPIYKII